MRGTKWLVIIAVVAIAVLFAHPVESLACNGGTGGVIKDIDKQIGDVDKP